MEFRQIQELIKMVNKSNIGELSIEENKFKLVIKQKQEASQNFAPMQFVQPPQNYQQSQQTVSQPASVPAQIAAPKAEAPKQDNYITIKSPMIGTFYRRSSPDKPVFVEVGDEVAPGKVVCIIEAMKLFNEIESEISGRIVKVIAEDASPVEYDQPLFLVEPN